LPQQLAAAGVLAGESGKLRGDEARSCYFTCLAVPQGALLALSKVATSCTHGIGERQGRRPQARSVAAGPDGNGMLVKKNSSGEPRYRTMSNVTWLPIAKTTASASERSATSGAFGDVNIGETPRAVVERHTGFAPRR